MKKKWIVFIAVAILIITGVVFSCNRTLAGTVEVCGDFKGEKTVLSWESIEGADSYNIYRKNGKNGNFRLIGSSTDCRYIDEYRKSASTEDDKKLLKIGMFVDPSENPYVYKVKAVSGKGIFKKMSEGTEDFHIEAPSIVSVKEKGKTAEICWSLLPNAEEYIVYIGKIADSGIEWEESGRYPNEKGIRKSAEIDRREGYTFYTVKAVFTKNGNEVYSDYDSGFNTAERKYGEKRILFLGDSITFGSPYKSKAVRNIFSYPARIRELTGAQIYVPSIPGASYGYREEKDRDRIVTQVAEKIHRGEIPLPTDKRIVFDGEPGNFADFDVIVLAAGANDYFDNIPLGKVESRNIKEFSGAVNTIMDWIDEGNRERISLGKEPVKLVFSKLFYNNNNGNYSRLTFRVPEKNGLGLKMSDYQITLDKLIDKYKKQGFDIYEFETRDFVTEENFPYVTSDGLHMSRFTYGKIGNAMAEFLIAEKII